VLALHGAAQLPVDPPELDDDDADDEDDDEDDEEELDELEPLPLSGPTNCQRVVTVGFQPVEL
jgi:hypothetical protein